MSRAASNAGAAGETDQTKTGADSGGGDGEGQDDAHESGDEDAHPEGLESGRLHDEVAEKDGALADRGSDQESEQNAENDRNERGHDDVDRGTLRDQLAEEHGNDDDEEHGERSALRAEGVGSEANGQRGVHDERGSLHAVRDSGGHSGALHGVSSGLAGDEKVLAGELIGHPGVDDDVLQQGNVHADRVDDAADQQRREQTVSHAAQAVDENALRGELNVLLFAVLSPSLKLGVVVCH